MSSLTNPKANKKPYLFRQSGCIDLTAEERVTEKFERLNALVSKHFSKKATMTLKASDPSHTSDHPELGVEESKGDDLPSISAGEHASDASADAVAGAGSGIFSDIESSTTIGPWQDPSGKIFKMEEINGRPVFMVTRGEEKSDSLNMIAIEMYFYTLRLLNAMLADNPENLMLKKSLILTVFNKIFHKIQEDKKLSERLCLGKTEDEIPAIINAYFDAKRPEYAELIQRYFIQEIQKSPFTATLRTDWKSYLAERTAGAITVAWENADHSVDVIEMCEQSSHSKKHASPAIAPMTHYAPNGEVELTHFRCPSLVHRDAEPLSDQIKKLMAHHDELLSRRSSSAYTSLEAEDSSMPLHRRWLRIALSTPPSRMMIYNLMTSFPLIDPDHQARTATAIFHAAHEYNREELETSHTLQKLFIPMNIPVNQQSENLRFDNPSTSEALYLSHIGVALSTLKEIAEYLKFGIESSNALAALTAIEKIKNLYLEFLGSKANAISQSTVEIQRELFEQFQFIQRIVPSFVHGIIKNPEATVKAKIQAAFLKSFYDKYMPQIGRGYGDYPVDQKIYGAIVQTLHLATSEGNVAGCKSANDRFGLVWNILETLKTTAKPDIERIFTQFLRGEITPDVFTATLYAQTNKTHCHGAGHMPSIVDVGGAKYRVSKTGYILIEGALNFANVPAIFTNLKTKKSESIQGHKKQALVELSKTRAALEKACDPHGADSLRSLTTLGTPGFGGAPSFVFCSSAPRKPSSLTPTPADQAASGSPESSVSIPEPQA